MKYIVAGVGVWNEKFFKKYSIVKPGKWYLVQNPEKLEKLLKSKIKPNYIFFLHWRWKVPSNITSKFECVCFHMTDLPFGRGGSPLQNLIVLGYNKTILTALRMDQGMDTGPIYLKKRLSLIGRAEKIYENATKLSWTMINDIIEKKPKPYQQCGKPTIFKRRTPSQSELGNNLSKTQIYDFIRMLDAPGYPKAFLETENYKLIFERPVFRKNELYAQVKITCLGMKNE